MRRFKWLGLGLAVGVLSLGLSVKTYVASWNRKEVMIASVEAKPDLVDEYATVGKDNEWILRNFQPRIIDWEESSGANYLLAEYSDSDGRHLQARIFLSGKTPDGQTVAGIPFEDQDGQTTALTFNELKTKLTVGEQVRVEYLNFKGKSYDRDSCKKYGDFCALGSAAEKGMAATLISRKLYEK